MRLQDAVQAAFEPHGVLASRVSAFRPRSGQLQMAQAIARKIEHGGALVVEAGTGVGKTFSYLIPALLSGQRVLLSTATKNLQDQLFERDLPLLIQALALPLRVALLKGRGSYLCLHRMALAHHQLASSDHAVRRQLAAIEIWAHATQRGDLAELPELDERSALLPLVTSTRDNCLGFQCPRHSACHVNLARREALLADVVVVNHHLFFADLAVRESGLAELLPAVNTVIFDEAHQINEIGVQFLGQSLSTAQLLDLARDVLAVGQTHAPGLRDWNALAADLEHASRDLRMLLGPTEPGAKLSWSDAAPQGVDDFAWADAMQVVRTAVSQAFTALESVGEMAPELQRLGQRTQALIKTLELFVQTPAPECVRWVEPGAQLLLIESPLDIASAIKSRVLKQEDEAGDGGGEPIDPLLTSQTSGKSWIFTSATLGTDDKLSWFVEPCGLIHAETLKVDSPFDYPIQASVYVPRHWPPPSDAAHSLLVANLAARAAQRIGGRTLVLTTSLRALKLIAEGLRQALQHGPLLDVLEQGQQPKRVLMQRLREGAQAGQTGCILVASASFWEGVDVPGNALQLVVIDKLPFPSPGDLLVQARTARLEAMGRNPFNDYFLPEAAVALKQGAGRLIRHENDRGVLVICDARLATKGYGRRLMRALPPMRQLHSEQEFEAALAELPELPPRV
jgi:ATP-dependent DNA helicase DinG